MRKMRERVLDEDFRTSRETLIFSCKQVELTPLPGERTEGFFEISAACGCQAEGFVRTYDERMTCLTPYFCGENEQIEYQYDADGMQEGESRSGRFFIVSNYGEYELDYKVSVRQKELAGQLGEIRNLFHFTNLARTNWQEAVKLFYTDGFKRIFEGQDAELFNLYRGFSRHLGNEANVEEFLVAVRKKQPVTFSSVMKEIRIPDIRGRAREDILVLKNGWGPARISAEAEGGFLTLEKSWLTDDDFLGKQCRVPVFLDEDRMHEGRNFGRVNFTCPHGSFSVPVIVEKRGVRAKAGDRRQRELKKCNLRMVKLYQELRMKRINTAAWRAMALECVEQMAHLPVPKAVPKLFKAHLLITEDKMEEAGWILDHVPPFLEDAAPAVNCYYLYLTTLYNREDVYVRRTALKVEEMYDQNPEEWRIAWLLLFLSRDINRSASKKWLFLEKVFQGGCTSPVMYLEALALLNAGPTLLQGLDSTAKRLLLYGAKNRMIGPDLTGYVIYLIDREKYYDEILFEILKLLYEERPETETLQAVCALLIKGGKTGAQFYPWYLKGVEKELRVTRLYEHFMMSVDLEKEVVLPRIVLLYFAYQSNLEYEYAAYLYDYVERHRQEDQELYAAYRTQIDRFVLQQLHRGRVNRHLARLYRAAFDGPMLTKDSGKELAALLCSVEFHCQDEAYKKLVVVHDSLQGEKVYVLHQGCAVIDLYSGQDVVFLEDENRSRRLAGGGDTFLPLFKKDELMRKAAAFAGDTLSFHLAVADPAQVSVNEENAASCEAVAWEPALTVNFGNQVREALIGYYFSSDRMEALDEMLRRLKADDISSGFRPEAIRCLTLRGFYDKAYEWLWGMELSGMDAGVMLRLCSRLLELKNHADEERLTDLCYKTAALGKYDGLVLKRLTDRFEGGLGEMEALKTAAEGFGIDTYPLCERLLEQMLFTGADVTERMDLLRQYINEGGRSELEAAFLHRCAKSHVILEQPIHLYMIHEILRMEKNGDALSDMCRIACLTYFSKNRDARDHDTDVLLARMGTLLISENRILPVFKEYADLIPAAEYLLDKTFVVYKGKDHEKVILNYRILRGKEADEDYESMEMPYIYAGISAASFILFAGESLQYYVTGPGGSEVLDSGLLKAGECCGAEINSRFVMLNAAVRAQLFEDDGQSVSLLENYLHTDFGVKQLFTPLQIRS